MSKKLIGVAALTTILSCASGAWAAPEAAAEQRIEEALDSPTTLEFIETPLQDVVDYLKSLHKIEIQIDNRALDDVGLGADTPITRNLKGIKLRSALALMLREIDLTWTIRYEVLLITTPEESEAMRITKVYPVADLLSGGGETDDDQLAYDYDSLVDTIASTIAPTSWDGVGGPGSICVAPFPRVNALVVSQTYRVHHQIAKLLEQLRKVAREGGDEKKPADGTR